MTILAAIAVLLHLTVVVKGGVFLLEGCTRCGDRNVVTAIVSISVMYLVIQAVIWALPAYAAMAGGAATSLLLAYSVATGALFLALIGCFTHYATRVRNQHGRSRTPQ